MFPKFEFVTQLLKGCKTKLPVNLKTFPLSLFFHFCSESVFEGLDSNIIEMAPDPGQTKDKKETRTVGCSITKAIPDALHIAYIEKLVRRVHEATIHASALLNLHIRRCLKEHLSLKYIFD